jgi:acyl carrier protein
VRGYRIELGEIEAALASHPAVQSCAVLAREDTPGNKQLVAYAVARREMGRPPTEDVRAFLAQRLPDYMVPAHLIFLESLPLTQNGKIDRGALPAPSLAAAAAPGGNVVAPHNEIESAIAAIWEDVLRLSGISIDADFFELGGQSLLAIQVLAKINERFGVDLLPQAFLENSTVAALAALVSEEVATARTQDGTG